MKRFFTLLFLLIGTTVLMAQSTTKELRVSVFFASASHTPTASELAKLTDFSTDLTSYADYSLKIEAFTDEQGTPDYNDALAKRRAKAITEALANHTVIANSTEVLSYGELQARANTINDAERQQDRRVDLVATVTQWADATAALNTIRKAQKQAITITNPSARQSFRGRQGGVFMLEPNSLVRPDGSLAKGPVSINLVEAYDLSDMLLAGLTTTAAGKRLVTGGMINLTATDADGVELELREGAAMTASIPTDDFNERMRIFSGAGHNATGTPTDWDLTEGGVAASAEGLFAAAPTEPDVVNIAVDARKLVGPQLARWRVANPKPKEPRYVNPNTIYVRAPKPINLDRVKYHKPKGLRGLFTSMANVDMEPVAKK
ncbi:MAG: OmpA family protein [Bacteroidota bacterium]